MGPISPDVSHSSIDRAVQGISTYDALPGVAILPCPLFHACPRARASPRPYAYSCDKHGVQVPERTTASFLGMPVPFADNDGKGIPLTVSQSKAVTGSISL